MNKGKLKSLWKKVMFANVAIVITGFVTGYLTGNYYLFLLIAAIGMGLEFAFPSIVVMLSDQENQNENN